MLNKKGFTVVEVVVTFTFVVIILTSMFAVVINYQNETEKERVKSSIMGYRNSILEIVYDDIVAGNMQKMETCGDKCVQIITKSNTYVLEASTDAEGNAYLKYRDTNYILPDSKNGLSIIENFEFRKDDINKVYEVRIPVIHAELNDEDNDDNAIEIVVSGKELNR